MRKILRAIHQRHKRIIGYLLLIAFTTLWMRDKPIAALSDLIPTNYRNIVNAHALETKGRNIPIAVIDSGLQRDHKDYSANLGRLWNPTDYSGDHGSGVVSVITKIAPKCEIYFFENSDLLGALERSLRSPARIVNISWSCNYEIIRFVLVRLAKAGKIIVMSAGNEGVEIGQDPNTRNLLEIAELPELKGRLLLVASVEHRYGKEHLSPYSNYASFEGQPLVCAPGSRILTAIEGDRHDLRDGTSFAAPQVTGLLALLMEEFPYYPPEWYVALVTDSARKLQADGVTKISLHCGHGIISAKDAITLGRKRQKLNSNIPSKTKLKAACRNIFNPGKTNFSGPFAFIETLHDRMLQEIESPQALPPYFETRLKNQLLSQNPSNVD